jgi:hypothetical protein
MLFIHVGEFPNLFFSPFFPDFADTSSIHHATSRYIVAKNISSNSLIVYQPLKW